MAGVTEAQVHAIYQELLGRPADQEGIIAYLGKPEDEVRTAITGSIEYINRQQDLGNPIPHTLTYDGRPITDDEARRLTRALYRQCYDVEEVIDGKTVRSQINSLDQADRMADDEVENLIKNAKGLARYSGRFDEVLARHWTTARERAGLT